MIFQYNPGHHYINETLGRHEKSSTFKEYEITETDMNVASPKIKYNLHDLGGIKKYKDIIEILEIIEPKWRYKFINSGGKLNHILKLPFLFVVGRSDGTISLDGANIFPHQIDMCIYQDKKLSSKMSNFKMHKESDKKQNIHFKIFIELKEGIKKSRNLAEQYEKAIIENLPKVNDDFEESYRANTSLKPKIELFENNTGYFKKKSKIKNKYII